MPSAQELCRLARRIHGCYEQRQLRRETDQQANWDDLQHRFEQVHRQRLLVEKARSHGWHLAADQLQERLCSLVRAVEDAVRDVREILAEPSQQTPSLKDVLTELQHLDMEFDNVVIDKTNFLAVETQRITLEEINLGRFSLRLHWPRLAHQSNVECLQVVALDPNPASDDDHVRHPHVKSGRLCAGDATLPLQAALEQGRLMDAFLLVRSVLETYNQESAYVRLDDWDGVSCWGCGCSPDADDRYSCESCDHDVCYDCTSSCKHCDHMRCASCQTRCDVCNEACCHSCLTTSACSELECCKDCIRVCAACNAEVAPDELDESTKLCSPCQEAASKAEAVETNALVPASNP